MRMPRVPDAFELLIAWLCLGTGLPMALGAPAPMSLQRALPHWLINCWGGTLFLGGLLIVVGIGLRHRHPSTARLATGLRVEVAGLMPLAAGSAVFGIVIAAAGGWRGMFAAGTYVMFAVACLLRSVEVRDAERGLRSAVTRSEE
jgi:hypothetical protein